MKREYWNSVAEDYEDEIFSVYHHDENALIRRRLDQFGGPEKSATDIGSEMAALNGILVNDGGSWCDYRFVYLKSGGSRMYYTSWASYAVANETFSMILTGLTPDTRYNFYAEVQNAAGKSAGWDSGIESFTTLSQN